MMSYIINYSHLTALLLGRPMAGRKVLSWPSNVFRRFGRR